MSAQISHDQTAWAAVQRSLRAVLDAIDCDRSHRQGAPIHHRLAVIGLQRAALEVDLEPDTVAAALAWKGDAAQLDRIPPAARIDAIGHLQDALVAEPTLVDALRGAVTLATVDGRWAGATMHLQSLAECAASDTVCVRALLKRADILHRKMSRTVEARAALLVARERIGDDPTVLDRLLKIELERKSWEAALEICYSLIERLGTRPEAASLAVTYRLTLGEIHLWGLDSPTVALRHYLEAMQLLPGYTLAYTLLEELLEQQDGWQLVNSLEQLPTRDRTHLGPSIEALRVGLEANPDDPKACVTAVRLSLQKRSAGLAS